MKFRSLFCVIALVAASLCYLVLGGQSGCPNCTDLDGDGFAIEGLLCGAIDCDDTDPAVNPGVVEGPLNDPTCSDGIDNDCDLLIDIDDAGCIECTDGDGDGYGDPASGNCSQLELDCDDTNPDVNPGADEAASGDPVCSDGIDNDCDGTIDAGDPGCHAGIIADHNAAAAFDLIPEAVIEQIGAGTSIFYGHTSHGGQIVSGMNYLSTEDSIYAYNSGAGTVQLAEYSDDLGYNGDVSWVPITRDRLGESGNGINVVMWSWCGGVSENTVEGINIYLEAMNQLELDYPNVTFVYMTGHLDGTGPAGTLYLRNNQIREYCVLNDKVLFDFADIESYDPGGNYYPNDDESCNWCSNWCSAHSCPSCDCTHSHCFNCYLKGKAFWWMMARIAGWS